MISSSPQVCVSIYTYNIYNDAYIYIIIYCMINYMWKNALSYIIIYTCNYIWVYKIWSTRSRNISFDFVWSHTHYTISFHMLFWGWTSSYPHFGDQEIHGHPRGEYHKRKSSKSRSKLSCGTYLRQLQLPAAVTMWQPILGLIHEKLRATPSNNMWLCGLVSPYCLGWWWLGLVCW